MPINIVHNHYHQYSTSEQRSEPRQEQREEPKQIRKIKRVIPTTVIKEEKPLWQKFEPRDKKLPYAGLLKEQTVRKVTEKFHKFIRRLVVSKLAEGIKKAAKAKID
jgi:hypothetical protein